MTISLAHLNIGANALRDDEWTIARKPSTCVESSVTPPRPQGRTWKAVAEILTTATIAAFIQDSPCRLNSAGEIPHTEPTRKNTENSCRI
jgi:hypothetical protein